MRLGAQMSVAGGLHNAFQRGDEAGCDSIMIFTKSNRRWTARPLTDDDIARYLAAAAEYAHITPVAVHASYLINIASSNPELWEKSYQALKTEVERADAIGATTLTFHPGAYVDADEETGLANIARALNRLLQETEGLATVICLETTAGTGTTLGYRFEHLAYLIEATGNHERLGVCFDTCHVFSAGYDIRTPQAYAETMEEFDRVVGLERIHCFHFNDSRYGLGERKDRHAHIGEGEIGLEGFANFVNDPRFADHPAHLETPKTETDEEGNDVEMDPVNLKALRDLIREKA
ncbi:MAG: deoxyribonuclease IV [Chloroflexota bacterium]